jgi:hypothetical protein
MKNPKNVASDFNRPRFCAAVPLTLFWFLALSQLSLSLFRLLRPDARLANDAAIVVILLAKKCPEIRAAHPNRKEPLAAKLLLDIRCSKRRGERVNEGRYCVRRRLRWREHSEPRIYLVILVSRLGNGWPSGSISTRVRVAVASARKVPAFKCSTTFE